TMVVYFFTVFFRSAVTDYPVFEAGAGWASKSSHQVNVFLDYSKCKSDVLLYNVDTFVNFEELIKPNDHDRFFLQLTDSLNRMIQHLNKGRIIAQATNDRVNLIRELSIPNFPLSEHRPTSYNSINYIDNELKDTFENYLPLIKKYLLDNIARERFERV
ncbi:MAG: hypothetical protein RBT65_19430, partial [Methanolobus sp.]|nr:hypothetical protein [Methanolobus sp.]